MCQRTRVLLQLWILANAINVIRGNCNRARTKKEDLKNDLFCSYDDAERPVLDHKTPTNVSMNLVLKNIEFDMHSQGLTLNFWLSIKWTDEFLTWKPEDYGNIKRYIVEASSIWKPDVSIYNLLDQTDPKIINADHCLVENNGSVLCVSSNNHEIECQPNLKYFPFDTQNCSMVIGSWVHAGEDIDLESAAVDVDEVKDMGEWQLQKADVYRLSSVYDCCPNETYPSIIYRFFLRRNSGVHVCMVIVPALTMCLMTMTAFFIELEKMERTVVICSNLIVHFLYGEYVGWTLPVSGPNPPLILVYTRDSMLLTILLLVFTTMLRKLLRCQRPSPSWIATATGFAMNSRVVQLTLMFDGNLKNVAARLGDEDGHNIVENVQTAPTTNNDWVLVAKILDRLFLFAYGLSYFIFIVAFVP